MATEQAPQSPSAQPSFVPGHQPVRRDPDVVECLPEADVVKIAFPSGLPYVLNTQRPVREVWLAADRNAWHFRYDGARWLDKRSGDELMGTVERLVKARAGVALGLV
jgi:CyaY protein